MKNIIILFATILFCCVSNLKAENMKKELTLRQQKIVTIAANTAIGNQGELKIELNEGLNNGLTINEIKEILVQLYAYTGFPRSLNALGTFMEIINERKEKGIEDEIGQEATPIRTDKTINELGTEVQSLLVGAPVKNALMDFAPAIDKYLKEHLFGDIFGRDNLDYQSRELATIGALAALRVSSQLRSHLNIAMNIGLTIEQLQSLSFTLYSQVGEEEGDLTSTILNDIQGKEKQISRREMLENKEYTGKPIFPIGEIIDNEYFSGKAWLQMLVTDQQNFDVVIGNVTFEPGVRNNWHSHPGGQILLCTEGQGYYQEEGKPIRLLNAGDVVEILPNVVHWHGATPDSRFSHIAISTRVSLGGAVWMQPVSDEEYNRYKL